MIECRNLCKSFADNNVIAGVSFLVPAGERVSLVGPGGCGKTTVLKLLLGVLAPDEGEAKILDKSLVNGTDEVRKKTLQQVGMAFQQGGLFDFMTVGDNLAFAMEHMTDLSQQQMQEVSQRLLQAVKLARAMDLFPYELSGGMQRRVGIARALCTDPKVAIFDEPTSGLDPVTSTIILNMISDLTAADPSKALLIATSNVEIAIRFSSRIIVINEGVVAADGPWRELIINGPAWVKHFLSVRFIGLDRPYLEELDLPDEFIEQHT